MKQNSKLHCIQRNWKKKSNNLHQGFFCNVIFHLIPYKETYIYPLKTKQTQTNNTNNQNFGLQYVNTL